MRAQQRLNPSHILVRAAAGTGKTVALTKAYLRQLLRGRPVESVVAITFTRLAAAELVERISDVLVIALKPGSPEAKTAGNRVADPTIYWDETRPFTAPERQRLERARAALGGAPVGTVDQFVGRLLAEFALDARLPVGDGESVALDILSDASADIARLKQDAARAIVTPPHGAVDPRVARLLLEMDPRALMDEVTKAPARGPRSTTAASSARAVLEGLAAQLGAQISAHCPGEDLRQVLLEIYGAIPPAKEQWPKLLKKAANKGGKLAADDVAAWLVLTNDTPPEALFLWWCELSKKVRESVTAALKRPDWIPADLDALVSVLADASGSGDTCEFLLHHFKLRLSDEELFARVEKALPAASKPHAGTIVRWLNGSESVPSYPIELLVALGKLNKTAAKRRGEALEESADALEATVDGTKLRIPPADLVAPASWYLTNLAEEARIEARRKDLSSLRHAVQSEARKRQAMQGTLDYDPKLEAAIGLCERAASGHHPTALRGRFQALLVDEVQDSSPAQVDFYLALADTNPGMDTFFVGDSRQSIYLFRGAAPAGMDRLQRDRGRDSLDTNWRSTPALVAAQKELFGARLEAALEAQHLGGLESLEALKAGRKEASAGTPVRVLQPPDDAERWSPQDIDRAALEAFAQRLLALWAEADPTEGAPATAAVLSPSWSVARNAERVLRDLLGPNPETGQPRAFVDGSRGWEQGRVVRDLRLLIAALSDPNDKTAWLGVWKHPMVGLSDRALARIMASPTDADRGMVYGDDEGASIDLPGWTRHLRWMLEAKALTAPHDAADIAAFARARGPLRDALRDIGRRPISEVIVILVDALEWRAILAVSPERDAQARLELALDWIRDLDAGGASPLTIVDALQAEGADVPKLRLHRPAQHVSCTTVFQAKGLKWDHICVLRPGCHSGGDDAHTAALGLADGKPHSLLGFKIDVAGAMAPKEDAMALLLKAIRRRRKLEECMRLTYVAITRAAESVVLALPSKGSDGNIVGALRKAWLPAREGDEDHAAAFGHIEVQEWEALTAPSPEPGAWVGVAENAPDVARSEASSGKGPWRAQAPSALHSQWTSERRTQRALTVAGQALAAGSWGGALYDNPVAPPLVSDSVLDASGAEGSALDGPAETEAPEGRESERGTLVHSWLEAWCFDGIPDAARVDAWLALDWDLRSVPVRDWLLSVSDALRGAPDHPLWAQVTDSQVTLHPELAVLVPVGGHGADPESLLLGGEIDLLIRDPRRPPAERWTVIDYKAGRKSPTGPNSDAETLVKDAGLKIYAPQLDGYAAAVNAALASHPTFAGEGVGDVALWFVRTGGWVSWKAAP